MGGFEHIADDSGEIWRAFGVDAQPAYVFIDDDGGLARQIGALDDASFVAALEQLVATN